MNSNDPLALAAQTLLNSWDNGEVVLQENMEALRDALASRATTQAPAGKACKYGDALCPCQDGDACHYEGKKPFTQAPAEPDDLFRLSADLTRAKNLLVRLHAKHPETRAQIEGSTGSWFVWGTDRDSAAAPAPVERGGLSIDDINPPPHLRALVVSAWNHNLPELKAALTAIVPSDEQIDFIRQHCGAMTNAEIRAALPPAVLVEPRTDGAPQEIWLQLHGDGEPDGKPVDYTDDVSWCWHKVHEHDVRYVLAAHAVPLDQKPNANVHPT